MMEDNKKRSLGRGLEALLGEMSDDILLDEISPVNTGDINSVGNSGNNSNSNNTDTAGKANNTVNVSDIFVSSFQPRKEFNEETIRSLAESIKEKGVLQPLIVREKDGRYELIAGERRLRASKLAGLTQVPVIVKDLSDTEVLEIALIENLLRENLSAIEEAAAYQNLMDNFSHTQERVAAIVGKSRSYIANTLRLLSLSDHVKALITDGKLSAGHARNLVGLDNADALADKIVKEDLSVREVELLVAKQKEQGEQNVEVAVKSKPTKSSDIIDIEKTLNKNLGLRLKISPNKQGGGKVVLQYASVAELDMIINILKQRKHPDIKPQDSVFKSQDDDFDGQNGVFKAPEDSNEKFSIKFVE